jgi:hypothetical protein
VEDQVIVVDPKDALQISMHNLETVSSKYRLKISTSKAKTIVFQGTDPEISKTVVHNNNIMEQIQLPRLLYFIPE